MTKKPQRKKAGRGRPRADISVEEIKKLAALHCTQEEAAGFLGISKDTIKRRLKEPKYREAWENGMATGNVSLRRTQFRLAETSATMAIFLGKQHLGQKEVSTNELIGRVRFIDDSILDGLTDEQFDTLKRAVELLTDAGADTGGGAAEESPTRH